METAIVNWFFFYWDNGKKNGNNSSILGLGFRD